MSTTSQQRQETERLERIAASTGTAVKVDYSGPILRFNQEDYVRKGDVPKIVQEGARQGSQMTASKMRRSPAYRRSMG